MTSMCSVDRQWPMRGGCLSQSNCQLPLPLRLLLACCCCCRFGKIVSVKVLIDCNTGRCKGTGLVLFDSHDTALRAIQQLNIENISARFANKNRPASSNSSQDDPTNLYFSNLPVNADEEFLQHLVGRFGKTISTKILRDAQGQSKRVGFCRMSSADECQDVIRCLHNYPVNGSALQVRLAKCRPGRRGSAASPGPAPSSPAPPPSARSSPLSPHGAVAPSPFVFPPAPASGVHLLPPPPPPPQPPAVPHPHVVPAGIPGFPFAPPAQPMQAPFVAGLVGFAQPPMQLLAPALSHRPF
eukprot:m.43205 g.43205  ORF g.43205 m.43205 type:complete len:298 (-) comp6142_c0_seq2:289-1182(-)